MSLLPEFLNEKTEVMKPKEFKNKFMPYALQTQQKTGIDAYAILAQSAVESGWGEKAPGNMMFGVKDTDGINGNEQLITTTEYLKTANAKFPSIISIVWQPAKKLYKYIVKDWFRKYPSPEVSFTDHANFFFNNKRYAEALRVKHDAKLFIRAIAKAGYASDPNYANVLCNVVDLLKRV